MSERDPRYDPLQLLMNATEEDIETAAEWSALHDFHKIAEEWERERQTRDNIIKHSATTAKIQPVIQDHLKLQFQKCQMKIEQLRDQLTKMSQSDTLKPVVERTYEKVIRADLIVYRKEQEAALQRELQEISDQYSERCKISEKNRHNNTEEQKQQTIIVSHQNQQEPSAHHKPKPKVFRSIITSLLALFIFGAIYLTAYVILAGIVYILSLIPVVSSLWDLLFYWRGDSPDMLLAILAPTISFFITMTVQDAINKDKPTKGLSCVLLGIFLMTLHIISFIINLIYEDVVLANITQAIAGFIIFRAGRAYLEEP